MECKYMVKYVHICNQMQSGLPTLAGCVLGFEPHHIQTEPQGALYLHAWYQTWIAQCHISIHKLTWYVDHPWPSTRSKSVDCWSQCPSIRSYWRKCLGYLSCWSCCHPKRGSSERPLSLQLLSHQFSTSSRLLRIKWLYSFLTESLTVFDNLIPLLLCFFAMSFCSLRFQICQNKCQGCQGGYSYDHPRIRSANLQSKESSSHRPTHEELSTVRDTWVVCAPWPQVMRKLCRHLFRSIQKRHCCTCAYPRNWWCCSLSMSAFG